MLRGCCWALAGAGGVLLGDVGALLGDVGALLGTLHIQLLAKGRQYTWPGVFNDHPAEHFDP
ncbi:hypothetical protein GCM10027157_15400 [Corynebacterium aquatimens]